MMTMSFLLLLGLFLGVGLAAVTQKQSDPADYLLAGRSVNRWAIALSAMASGQSGFKFIGLIGFAYLTGASAIWVEVGWFIGDWLAWHSRIPQQLREQSARENTLTLPTFLAKGSSGTSSSVRLVVAAVIFLFLSAYAAAQFSAAGKSLQTLLDWSYETGTVLSAVLIFLYCFAGGIRASIWTDVVQAIIMLAGMYLLLGMCLHEVGGIAGMWTKLESIDPQLVAFMPDGQGALVLLLFSLIVSGFGVLGQPHVMVRTMAIKDPKELQFVGRIYVYLGYTMSFCAFFVGLAARALYPNAMIQDPEMVMPYITMELFHPVFAGCLLAAVFASTLSTADSQILVCASAFFDRASLETSRNYGRLKLATLGTVGFTLVVALYWAHVFSLVVFSWSVLASALTVLLIIRSSGRTLPAPVAFGMVVLGGATAVIWRVSGMNSYAYESLPGILASVVPLTVWWLAGGRVVRRPAVAA